MRIPLSQLPLSSYIPATQTLPSPISLPNKRGPPSPASSPRRKLPIIPLPCSLGYPETVREESVSTAALSQVATKARKIVESDTHGSEVIKKVRSRETPQRCQHLESELRDDELGVGRSPARRLFVGDGDGDGDGASNSAYIPPAHRPLAPSPPISDVLNSRSTTPSLLPGSPTRSRRAATSSTISAIIGSESSSSRSSVFYNARDVLSLHDCGFIIYSDIPATATLGTPVSRPNRSSPSAIDPSPHFTADNHNSNAGENQLDMIADLDDNQENIPPNILNPSSVSTSTSPQKPHSTNSSTTSSINNSKTNDGFIADHTLSPPGSSGGSGSGRKRSKTLERSRLGLEIVSRGDHPSSDDVVFGDGMGDGEEELTPGRVAEGKVKGKERMVVEMEMDLGS